jgi:hypothetical protein
VEQADIWPHANEHITEVDEDHQQNEGVWRQVLQLEPVELQQREEEGGQQRHHPSHDVAG